MFLVASPLVSTIPSPVPMSWSRKSPNGWMILLPSALGTVNCPPLMTEPTGAVVIERTWQTEQLSVSKSAEPGSDASSGTSCLSRAGALVERMKRVNDSTSSPNPMSPPVSSGSATVSKAATERPSEVFSVGWSGLVMPTSFR